MKNKTPKRERIKTKSEEKPSKEVKENTNRESMKDQERKF